MTATSDSVRFQPVTTRRAFEDAVVQIADKIRLGDLRLGDALPAERALAVQMGISRRTLREALKVLSDAGVLEVRAGAAGGTFGRSDTVPAEMITQREAIRLSEVSHLLEVRRLIEPQVAQMASVFSEQEDFAAMERTIDLQRAYVDVPARLLAVDTRFHLLMAKATRNPILVQVMRDLLAKIEIARDSALRGPNDPAAAVDLHERTLAALRSRDLDAVSAVMAEHLGFLEDRWAAAGGRLRLRQLPVALLPRVTPRDDVYEATATHRTSRA
jgi:GntR family transcriptional repressor for pyruvate dehydrogenase complex